MKLPPEQEAIRAKCFHPTGSFVPFPSTGFCRSVSDVFQETAKKFSTRTALSDGNQTVTYDELNKMANRIARNIIKDVGEKNCPAATFLDNDASAAVSALAILKAGKILVVIDPSLPRERVAYYLRDSNPEVIITSGKYYDLVSGLVEPKIDFITVDRIDANLPDFDLDIAIKLDAITQIVYTSGSTGRPKGVIRGDQRITLKNTISRINRYHICSDDRFVFLYEPSAGSYLEEILSFLLVGGAVFSFNLKKLGFIPLCDYLVRERITILKLFPSSFRRLVSVLKPETTFPDLRLIQVAGEFMSEQDLAMYKQHFSSHCLLLHRYGINETSNVTELFIDKDTQISTDVVPVGYPVEGKEIFLLNAMGDKRILDEIGEIAVKGHDLALGYWNNPDLTAQSFLPDTHDEAAHIYRTGDLGRILADGCLLHLGRKDFQVRIRGYTVAPIEVEVALMSHPNVKQVAVIACDGQLGETFLAAYIVTRPGQTVITSELATFLRSKLPTYMIPAMYVFVSDLPMVGGKLDRRSLPPPERTRPVLTQSYTPATTLVEQKIIEIWQHVLDIRPIGIHDNFIDLGGHSLAATQIVGEILSKCQIDLPLVSLFEHPTVRGLAERIQEIQAGKVTQEKLANLIAKIESISDEDAQKLVSKERSKDDPS